MRADGRALDTCFLYVEDPEGLIYLLDLGFHHHHSSAVAGGPVAAAGSICFDRDGDIEVITDRADTT